MLNPSQIGLITELKCQTFFMEHGISILVPVGNYQKYDLVFEKDSKFYRIQCKHATPAYNSFIVSTKYEIRSTGKQDGRQKCRYTNKDCDFFMSEFDGKFYLFPVFGTTITRFWFSKQRLKNCRLAEDFLAEKILETLK